MYRASRPRIWAPSGDPHADKQCPALRSLDLLRPLLSYHRRAKCNASRFRSSALNFDSLHQDIPADAPCHDRDLTRLDRTTVSSSNRHAILAPRSNLRSSSAIRVHWGDLHVSLTSEYEHSEYALPALSTVIRIAARGSSPPGGRATPHSLVLELMLSVGPIPALTWDTSEPPGLQQLTLPDSGGLKSPSSLQTWRPTEERSERCLVAYGTVASSEALRWTDTISDVRRMDGRVPGQERHGFHTALEEPKARESLLTPTMRRTASKSSLSSPSETPASDASAPATSSSPSTLSVDRSEPTTTASTVSSATSAEFSPMPSMFHAAANAAALMERTPFAIDDAKDDEDESDIETDVEDDGVMDEVDAFLEAHDSGLTEAERELAQDLINAEPVK
ncbi:hypothetical protein NUW54_g5192 [Trametes sanguinea]|uniref:Uncharacterized protein n=1 Tax=Trametes sanguinea TaxID=158606 RepID=A0ACC1PXE9_9APHY|nr:hypothetical protein NUW54_g5192 [Trametes sanguinea]